MVRIALVNLLVAALALPVLAAPTSGQNGQLSKGQWRRQSDGMNNYGASGHSCNRTRTRTQTMSSATSSPIAEATSSPIAGDTSSSIVEATSSPIAEASSSPIAEATSSFIADPAPTTTKAADPTSSAAAPAGTLGAGQQEWLDAHNTVRSRHNAQPLAWSTKLEAAAQKWANNCVFTHSKGEVGPFGENLHSSAGMAGTPTEGVTSWANEAKDYNPAAPSASHFTQVVWKGAKELGCAIAMCETIFPGFGPAPYMVCEYDTGNVIGYIDQNVEV